MRAGDHFAADGGDGFAGAGMVETDDLAAGLDGFHKGEAVAFVAGGEEVEIREAKEGGFTESGDVAGEDDADAREACGEAMKPGSEALALHKGGFAAEEEDGVAGGAELDALIDAGEEAGGPKAGAAAAGGSGNEDDVGGEIAALGAQAVGEPGAEAGSAAAPEAGV